MVVIDYKTKISKHNKLRVEVEYNMGGMNYLTGNISKRGYYIFITPYSEGNDTKTYTMLGPTFDMGGKIFIKAAKRYSNKTLQKIRELVKDELYAVGKSYIVSDGKPDFNIIEQIKTKLSK